MSEITSGPGDPSEFDQLTARLRAQRPEIASLELDRLKDDVIARSQPRRSGKPFGTSAVLALAVLAGSAGVTFGAVALNENVRNAAEIQYGVAAPPSVVNAPPTDADDACEGDECLGVGDEGGPPGSPTEDREGSGDSQDRPTGRSGGDSNLPVEVRRPDQLASVSSGSLPFTGYLAIAALATSLILTSIGVLMGRKLRRTET